MTTTPASRYMHIKSSDDRVKEADPFHRNYNVLDVIGSGVFSEVLKCESRETGKLYACKRLNQKCKSFKELKNSAEVSSARLLPRNPNVVRLVEYFLSSGRVFLVFELMDSDLYALIRNRKELLPHSRIRPIMFQILSGLAHIHKYKIIHCDMKPENILVSLPHEIVKIADFGCAKNMKEFLPYEQVYVATRWYRAPESILTNGFYGFKIDLWAIGCIFYEILSLRPLFPGIDEVDQIERIHELIGPPPPKVLQYFLQCNEEERRTSPAFTIPRGKRSIGIDNMLSALGGPRSTDALDAWEDWEETLEQENGLDSLLKEVIPNDDSQYLHILALLKNLVHYDPNWRPTAEEALNYSYFKSSKSQ